jgi:hypothetical protein
MFRSRAALAAAAAPINAHDDELIPKVFGKTLVLRVDRIENIWVVALHEQAVRAALSRNAIRFGLPFNFEGAKYPICALAEQDPDYEMREVGRACLPEVLVYTPPLWALLRTPTKTTEPLWLEATVPVHFLYHWYRIVLLFLATADYRSSLYDEMLNLELPVWVTEPDLEVAHGKWRAERERNRREADRDVARQMCLSSRDAAHEVWVKTCTPTDDQLAAAAGEPYSAQRITGLIGAAMPASAEVYEVWCRHAPPFEKATVDMHEAYEGFKQRVEKDAALPEISRKDFVELRQDTTYGVKKQQKKLDAMREKRAEMQKQYEEQTEAMLKRYDSLCAHHLADLRRRHAASRTPMNLHVYAVCILNVIEDTIMALMGVPTNLRQRFHTPLTPPPPHHTTDDLRAQCDFLATEVVKAAARKRAKGGEVLERGWVLPARVTDAELAACTTADAYSEILMRLLDTWPAETTTEAAAAPVAAADPDE